VTQVPGGRLAELYGGKLVFGLGVFITGIFTAISPLAAKLGTSVFVVVRILEGLGEVRHTTQDSISQICMSNADSLKLNCSPHAKNSDVTFMFLFQLQTTHFIIQESLPVSIALLDSFM
jgi:MFS family permease